MSALLSGYGFATGGPYLVLDELGAASTSRYKWPIWDAPLTLTATASRRCTGYFDLLTYGSLPCPEQSSISADVESCFQCFRRTGFNPSFYNVPVSTISLQQRAYNEREHVVYLAYFGDGWAKVGISSRDRVFARIRGQGARVATVIAAFDDAYQARALEARIAKDVAIPEVVRGSRKRALINEPFDLASATSTLTVLRVQVEEICGVRALPFAPHDCSAEYLGGRVLDLPVTDMSAERPPSISGIGVGMIGDILVVRESERQFMLSVKDLLGTVVEIEPAVRRNSKRATSGQLGFGFL